MQSIAEKSNIMCGLRKEIMLMESSNKKLTHDLRDLGLGSLELAFPQQVFPIAALHDFSSFNPASAVATSGFIAGLAGRLILNKGLCTWISTKRTIFPPALKLFGINPDQIIFIDLKKPVDALWAIEESLKCNSLSLVIGEINELNFTQSRRLQLAIEKSGVTAFIHRRNPKTNHPIACAASWKIGCLPSVATEGLPGIGFPKWSVSLVKVRNGKPGKWVFEWRANELREVINPLYVISQVSRRNAG